MIVITVIIYKDYRHIGRITFKTKKNLSIGAEPKLKNDLHLSKVMDSLTERKLHRERERDYRLGSGKRGKTKFGDGIF